jgi:hypothetical protein
MASPKEENQDPIFKTHPFQPKPNNPFQDQMQQKPPPPHFGLKTIPKGTKIKDLISKPLQKSKLVFSPEMRGEIWSFGDGGENWKRKERSQSNQEKD